jgi:AraC-like DNA-binding protein
VAVAMPSDVVFEFVQRCQTVAGVCALSDHAAQAGALWTCLCSVPRPLRDDADAMAIAVAASRMASGFFNSTARVSDVSRRTCRTTRQHINELLAVVKQEYANPHLTLGSLAQRFDLSTSLLSRALAAETGHAYPVHVNGVRMLAAIRFLRDHDRQVKDIAWSVGYPDTRELDRQFQRLFGISPTRIAELSRQMEERPVGAAVFG